MVLEPQVDTSFISMASTSSTAQTRLIDESHPLHLHHEESPSIVLVSQPLIGENYSTCARSMYWEKQGRVC